MCLLFESIKIENQQVCNLEWHLQRMKYSLEHVFGCAIPFIPPGDKNNNGTSPFLIGDILAEMGFPHGILKCKMTYTLGIIDIQITPYVISNTQTYRLVECNGLNYDHKYADRLDIEELYGRRNGADDIIIVKNGCITDSSTANLVFFDGERYVTPDTPLLAGTHRARLLHQGIIVAERITPADIQRYQSFCPINAMSNDGFDSMKPVSQIVL